MNALKLHPASRSSWLLQRRAREKSSGCGYVCRAFALARDQRQLHGNNGQRAGSNMMANTTASVVEGFFSRRPSTSKRTVEGNGQANC